MATTASLIVDDGTSHYAPLAAVEHGLTRHIGHNPVLSM